jgi:hypothetical protein
MHHIRREARRLVAAGLSVIPLRPDGTKRPALDARAPYRHVRVNATMLRSWFRHGEGLAVIGGAVSGHLEILTLTHPSCSPLGVRSWSSSVQGWSRACRWCRRRVTVGTSTIAVRPSQAI